MNTVKDNRKWDIVVIREHAECDYLSYMANCRVCDHMAAEYPHETECRMDTCPIKRSRALKGLIRGDDI